MATGGADGIALCPGCARPFIGLLALDAHRRHHRAAPACRYVAGERRAGYRLGLYARLEATVSS